MIKSLLLLISHMAEIAGWLYFVYLLFASNLNFVSAYILLFIFLFAFSRFNAYLRRKMSYHANAIEPFLVELIFKLGFGFYLCAVVYGFTYLASMLSQL